MCLPHPPLPFLGAYFNLLDLSFQAYGWKLSEQPWRTVFRSSIVRRHLPASAGGSWTSLCFPSTFSITNAPPLPPEPLHHWQHHLASVLSQLSLLPAQPPSPNPQHPWLHPLSFSTEKRTTNICQRTGFQIVFCRGVSEVLQMSGDNVVWILLKLLGKTDLHIQRCSMALLTMGVASWMWFVQILVDLELQDWNVSSTRKIGALYWASLCCCFWNSGRYTPL